MHKPTLEPKRGPVWPPPPPPPPMDYLDTRCPTERHYAHPDMSCEQIGEREWDPIIGYRTEVEFAADPPQFTGLIQLALKES